MPHGAASIHRYDGCGVVIIFLSFPWNRITTRGKRVFASISTSAFNRHGSKVMDQKSSTGKTGRGAFNT